MSFYRLLELFAHLLVIKPLRVQVLLELFGGVNPDIISELVDVPVSRRCDQFPDNMPRCVFTSKEKIRIGLNAAMQLLRDDFVI